MTGHTYLEGVALAGRANLITSIILGNRGLIWLPTATARRPIETKALHRSLSLFKQFKR